MIYTKITRHLIILLLPVLASCTPVQHSSKLSQPINTRLVAGIGDTVLSISKEKNLPNAFGVSDIFGRTTPTGLTTVQYLGLNKGKAIFKRCSIVIETGATTMNSSPIVIHNTQTTTHTGIIGSAMYNGTSTASGPSAVIPPNTPQAQFFDQGAVEIAVDLNKGKKVIVEGKTITVEHADDAQVVYSISE